MYCYVSEKSLSRFSDTKVTGTSLKLFIMTIYFIGSTKPSIVTFHALLSVRRKRLNSTSFSLTDRF